jgi:hypothetical protein
MKLRAGRTLQDEIPYIWVLEATLPNEKSNEEVLSPLSARLSLPFHKGQYGGHAESVQKAYPQVKIQ